VSKKNIIHTIRNKEMDRKDFLKYSGLAVISLVGLKSVATMLLQHDNKQVIVQKEASRGFGSGRYGV
jgi:hypothetical protein